MLKSISISHAGAGYTSAPGLHLTKTLILGTCYLSLGDEGAQNYGAKLVKLWVELATHLNPDTDILLVDSASPIPAHEAIGFPRTDLPNFKIHQLGSNVGHLNTTGKDGFGRAFSAGVDYAIEHEYDYLAYTDADIICTQPVGPIVDKMHRSGVKACCPMDTTYNFLENGLMYLDVAYLRDSNFVERYDWKSRGPTTDPSQIPEKVFETLLADVLFTLPMRGLRNDFDRLTVNNFDHMWPYGGPDYLTHAKDYRLYELMLERAGIKL